MDRQMVLQHLALAESHVAQGEQHLQRQRELIEELARRGLNTAQAKSQLLLFEEMQRLHIADRKRLRGELESLR